MSTSFCLSVRSLFGLSHEMCAVDGALLGHADHGCPKCPPPVKNFTFRKIYASGGGLPVAPTLYVLDVKIYSI